MSKGDWLSILLVVLTAPLFFCGGFTVTPTDNQVLIIALALIGAAILAVFCAASHEPREDVAKVAVGLAVGAMVMIALQVAASFGTTIRVTFGGK
jgi:hypothetical protein